MKIAGSVDLLEVLAALGASRPVFHSEADFQHALAWQLHVADPKAQVRLETKASQSEHLDLLVSRTDLSQRSAIELKYMTNAADLEFAGEPFHLQRHGAQDIRGYDVIHDIVRLERFVADGYVTDGVMIALTNDSAYWRDPQHGRKTGAGAFRLYEGTTLSRTRQWGEQSSGTAKLRSKPLTLLHSYDLHWREYSQIGTPPARFRILIVEVGQVDAGPSETGSNSA